MPVNILTLNPLHLTASTRAELSGLSDISYLQARVSPLLMLLLHLAMV